MVFIFLKHSWPQKIRLLHYRIPIWSKKKKDENQDDLCSLKHTWNDTLVIYFLQNNTFKKAKMFQFCYNNKIKQQLKLCNNLFLFFLLTISWYFSEIQMHSTLTHGIDTHYTTRGKCSQTGINSMDTIL